MKKTILFVLFDTFPPDIRVQKVESGLSEAGYDIRIIAEPNIGEVEDRYADKVLDLYPRSPLGSFWFRLKNYIKSQLNPAFGASQISYRLLKKYAQQTNAIAIYWNDLAGAHIGIAVARALNIKFILDLHENYPYNMWSTERDLRFRKDKASPLFWIRRRYSLSAWFKYEKYILDSADLIVTVADEMSERLYGMHFVSFDKMVTFQNAEDPKFWDGQNLIPTDIDEHQGRDILIYVGSCSIHRGLEVIVKAMGIVKSHWPNLLFVIVGDGTALPSLKKLAIEMGLQDNVLILGQKPFSEVASYIKASIAGVVPHHRYGQTDNGAPHKLFQYMSLNRPILVSNCKGLERIVRTANAGFVFQSGNPVSAAAEILKLRDRKLRDYLGGNAREAAENDFSLAEQQRRLAVRLNFLINNNHDRV